GNLVLSLTTVEVSRTHAFDTDRRRIYGVIGRDVIADSLVFGFDRDRGIAWLQTQEAFHPPTGAHTLDYFKGTRSYGALPVRRLVQASVNGETYDLHLDLGDVPSQLRQQHWSDAKLRPVGWNMMLVDEVGSRRLITTDAIADQVKV